MPKVSGAILACIACEVCVTKSSAADKLRVRRGHLQHMDVRVNYKRGVVQGQARLTQCVAS